MLETSTRDIVTETGLTLLQHLQLITTFVGVEMCVGAILKYRHRDKNIKEDCKSLGAIGFLLIGTSALISIFATNQEAVPLRHGMLDHNATIIGGFIAGALVPVALSVKQKYFAQFEEN